MLNADSLLASAKRAYGAGDTATAQRLSRSVLAAAPMLAEPWIILGYIELYQGYPDAALVMASKAVALESGNGFGHLLRCRALLACGHIAETLEAAKKGGQIPNCQPVALDGFGLIFLQLANYNSALDLFGRAVAASPMNVGFLYNLAFAERAVGKLKEAEHHFDRVIVANPDFYDAYFMRADLRKQTQQCNHIEQMESLIASGISNRDGAISIRFALGKECEDVGDYRRAIQHFKAGAALQRQHLKYDVKNDIALIDRIIGSQRHETLDALAADLSQTDRTRDNPIFIVGLPRSGTTLVERIVAGHGAVVAAGELGILRQELDRGARKVGHTRIGEWIDHCGDLDLPAIGHAYSRIAREAGIPAGRRFIDKYPPNFLLAGVIHLTIPNARIIVLRREPTDSCLALYKTLFGGNAYPYSYDLGEAAEYCAAFRRLIAHWRITLPEDLLLEVAYEEIVADLEGQSRRILDFLGLPWEDNVLRFHESKAPAATASALQVRQPIYSSSVGNWKNYAEQLGSLRTRLAELIPEIEM